MPPRPTRLPLAVLAIALAAVALSAQRPPTATFEEALARYQQCRQRKPLQYHTEGREALARIGSTEALQLLVDDYTTVKDYAEYSRYTLATLFLRHFCDDPFVAPLQQLRDKHKKPADTWLWVNVLAVETERIGPEAAMGLVAGSKTIHHRAAAIAGLSAAQHSDVFDAIRLACAAFPKKDRVADRYLLLGAMTGAVWDNRALARDARARAGMLAYINLLSPEVDLPHTAKVQMARHLMWTLDGPGLLIAPEPWIALLEHGQKKAGPAASTTAAPRFFGIETEGERFCYVVDLSDSMCREIDPATLPRGPITGQKKKPKVKGELPDVDDLPWHAIRTRFDLAREHLKLSLLRLPEDKHFSVVWFGSEAGTLPSSPGLVKATRSNVQKAIKDLDAIVPGPPVPGTAPDGQLRGRTNLHAGLRRAFSLSGREFVDAVAYVDPGPLTEGCDTIFLLSDGAPSWDEFEVVDKDYGEDDVVVDVEYQEKAARTPEVHYCGPYRDDAWLIDDVRRMNAFRRVRLHCIGIGEANMHLLDELAALGHGEVYTVGRAGPKK